MTSDALRLIVWMLTVRSEVIETALTEIQRLLL
jgi:hypothetical protein